MLSSIVKLVCTVASWFFSERRAKAKEKAERLKVADEVASGDEDKVNARLVKAGVLGFLVACSVAGCVVERTLYVREEEKARALPPGGVHTNTSEAVEWILPRAVMTRLVNAAEAK